MYDYIKYWKDRIKNHGSVNSSINATIIDHENYLLSKYIQKNDLVLDYGIGEGRLFPFYNKVKPIVFGYDIIDYSEFINKQREKHNKFEYYNCDVTSTKFSFDVVIAFSILTHIKPFDLRRIINEIMTMGKIAIISAYNDTALEINEDTYCFLHDYEEMFSDYKILETEKIDKIQYWVLKKQSKII